MASLAPDPAAQALFTALASSTSSSRPDPRRVNDALQLVRNLLPPNAPLSVAQAPAPLANLDRDPLPSLLSPPTPSTSSSSSAPPASPSNTGTSTSALAWLHSSLKDHDRAAFALEVLSSPRSDAEIQDDLLDIWGFDGLDDIAEAVRRRADIAAEAGALAEHAERRSAEAAAHLSSSAPHARDYVPGSQLTFATAEEVQAAKQARKAAKRDKGKGRADGADGEPDVEEWLRIREEQLARGPGALVSGKRVRRLSLSRSLVSRWQEGCLCTRARRARQLTLICTSAGRRRGRAAVPERLHLGQELGPGARRPEARHARRHDPRHHGGASPLSLLPHSLAPPSSLAHSLPFPHAVLRGDHDPGTKGRAVPLQRDARADLGHGPLGQAHLPRASPRPLSPLSCTRTFC